MNTWTPCSDALPDDDSTVLVARDDGEVWTGYHVAGHWHHINGTPLKDGIITHWMDMPPHPLDSRAPVATCFSSGDMADQAAKAFRAGMAAVLDTDR